jgi:chorismate dehydratase
MKNSDHYKSQTPSQDSRPEMGKRISMVDRLEFQPLLYGFKSQLIKHPFELIYTDPVASARCLREGEVELSLIPSIEYARSKETWNIVPDICLACSANVVNVQLFFKKGLRDLKKIAVDDQAASSATLLKIIMREKFMMNPDYVEMPADLNQMLSRADAALVTGDQALEYYRQNQNRLDLNEEWIDLAGLPFIYSFWAGREFTVTRDDIRLIVKSFDLGQRNMEQICKEYAAQHESDWIFYHDFLTKNISYAFSDKEKEGLLEFYNYAFFFGFIDYIPELHFYPL